MDHSPRKSLEWRDDVHASKIARSYSKHSRPRENVGLVLLHCAANLAHGRSMEPGQWRATFVTSVYPVDAHPTASFSFRSTSCFEPVVLLRADRAVAGEHAVRCASGGLDRFRHRDILPDHSIVFYVQRSSPPRDTSTSRLLAASQAWPAREPCRNVERRGGEEQNPRRGAQMNMVLG